MLLRSTLKSNVQTVEYLLSLRCVWHIQLLRTL